MAKKGPATKRKSKPSNERPVKSSGKPTRYKGPLKWLVPQMEATYAPLKLKVSRRGAGRTTIALVRPETIEGPAMARPSATKWEDVLKRFRNKKAAAQIRAPRAEAMARPGAPAVPGANNWTPLGPAIVARGQTITREPISGRLSGIAIAPDGKRIYVATANGGVWRSDDGGLTWITTMDGFDLDPTTFASASLICGAIALDPGDPNRVYVGTGEGDTDGLFANRITNALPAYRGVGPIRSDDGGTTWVQEPSTPTLAGAAFYQIAVDPQDREHCVAATTLGLYERVPAAGGGHEWLRRRTSSHASVVVARAGGMTHWFAAPWSGPVVNSTDGVNWNTLGTGFPATAGRIALGVQPDNPNVLYAFISTTAGALLGVRRLDGIAGAWKNITGVPAVLPGSQGDYDLCIAVDPTNADRIYLGGDYRNVDPYPASVWRCVVSPSGAAYSMAGTSIGENAHADVHCLLHAPADPSRLFMGCDGGLFEHTNATGAGGFVSRNTGLATLCANFLGQHPGEPAVMYVGLQDNGTAKCIGEQVWKHVLFADGGYCVVNWNDPFRILLFANGALYRATDGGLDYTSWSAVTPPAAGWATMTEPIVGTPIDTANPASADIVAIGSGRAVYISSDFGSSWGATVNLPAGTGSVFSLVFASSTRIFAGTTDGSVFRINKSGATWTATRLDTAAGGALPLNGLITDVLVDRTDAALESIFICFGGQGDGRHVWRFDGTRWENRSGTVGSGTELLDVEHNALQQDPATNRLYVGADIGVWESTDGGLNWEPMSLGLPDAPVYDLQIHAGSRTLRAALHGRGVFEWKLDAPVLANVELFVRDTLLDTGRGINTDGRPDPSAPPSAPVYHYLSPNIKVDVPTPAGYQTPGTSIDHYTFNELLVDGSTHAATIALPAVVHNRVYVEVHNRGRVPATNVQVMAVVTDASTGLLLPAGFENDVVNGTPLTDPKWTTLGPVNLPLVRAGNPAIAAFDLPSTALPLPASLPGHSHYCMAVFVHCTQDPYTASDRNVDVLTLNDRKTGQKNLHIVEFIGTPPGARLPGRWVMLRVGRKMPKRRKPFELIIDVRKLLGDLHLALPIGLTGTDRVWKGEGMRLDKPEVIDRWVKDHTGKLKKLVGTKGFSKSEVERMIKMMGTVEGTSPLLLKGGMTHRLSELELGDEDGLPIFIRIAPKGLTAKSPAMHFDVLERHPGSEEPMAGARFAVHGVKGKN
jgi:photosystem II stability/assembly factor-like uncharacterized protein